MKKVRLVNYATPDKSSILTKQRRYSIFLGNGKTLYFSTRKDLTYAMAEINRQLNVIVFELNEMWISAFIEYRRLWFYLPAQTVTSDDMKIMVLNGTIEKRFTLLATRSSWINGNSFSFKYLYEIIECLTAQLKMFREIRKEKNQYLESKIIEVKIKTLARIYQDIKTMDIKERYAQHMSVVK